MTDCSQVFLVVDNVIIIEVHNKYDVPLALTSTYYVFNICYPKGCHNFSFLEIKVLGVSPDKISQTVSHFLSRV